MQKCWKEKRGSMAGFMASIIFRMMSREGIGQLADRSRIDTLRNLGIKATVVPQHNVNDGINAVRKLLDMRLDRPGRDAQGLNALRNYRRQWDERLKMLADEPMHDWSSHGSDALRTFSSGYRDEKRPIWPPLDTPRIAGGVHERGTGWMARR